MIYDIRHNLKYIEQLKIPQVVGNYNRQVRSWKKH